MTTVRCLVEAVPVKIQESLNSAARFAATRWQTAHFEGREAETSLWAQMNGYREFIMETGQLYLFEKYLGERISTSALQANSVLNAREETVSYRIMLLLLKALDEALALEQRRAVALLIGLLEFLSDSGQLELVEDYVIHRLDYAPVAIARFTTQNEAQAWLNDLSEPTGPVRILIGDEYFLAWSSREDDARFIYRDYVIEPYIQELAARGIPAATPAFDTRVHAEQWLVAHPASPFAFVSLGGEYHVAVHHKRLGIHTLHPVAAALREWERMKAATEIG